MTYPGWPRPFHSERCACDDCLALDLAHGDFMAAEWPNPVDFVTVHLDGLRKELQRQRSEEAP